MANLKSSIQSIIDYLISLGRILNRTGWREPTPDLERILQKAEEVVDKALTDIEECKLDLRMDDRNIPDGLNQAQEDLLDIDFFDLEYEANHGEFAERLSLKLISCVENLEQVIKSLDEEDEMKGLSLSEDDFTSRVPEEEVSEDNSTIDENPYDNMSQMNEIYVTLVGFQYHISETERSKYGVGTSFKLQREEDNVYDPQAVGVYDGDRLVAYVKKHDAHTIWKALKYPMNCTVTEDGGSYMRACIRYMTEDKPVVNHVIPPMPSAVVEPFTKENLVALADTAVALADFIDSMVKDKEVREMLENSLHNNSDDAAPIEMVVKFILGKDVSTIYKKLGHRLGMGKPEGMGMVLLCHIFGEPDLDIDLSFGWKLIIDNMDHAGVEFQEECEGIFPNDAPGDFCFWIQTLLGNLEDESWMTRYMVLMYRFASLIAKADGKVTKKEAAWLAKLMQKPVVAQEEDDEEECEPAVTELEEMSEDKAMRDLMELIGLKEVKEEIQRLRSLIQIQNLRREQGLAVIPVSRHFVFTGNPGTGKTTVARILAQIYKDLGVVKGGQLIETDRSGLVAEYVGQTAVKTNKVVDSALDGVLFIDEAYSLVQGGKEDYGAEAIATLLKRMEDNRDRLVVILAGYSDEMQQFIDSNPGLQSRFNRYIHFPDYEADELLQIFKLLLSKNDFVLTTDGEQKLMQKLTAAVQSKTKNFGNARYVRNLFEKTLENQAVRLSAQPRISHTDLITIQAEDI